MKKVLVIGGGPSGLMAAIAAARAGAQTTVLEAGAKPGRKLLLTGNGRCKYLTEDNLCSIYTDRPNVCRGTYMYYKYFSHMSVEDYYAMITALCSKLEAHEKLY